MPIVNLAINGKNYEVACDAGQEFHLHDLAREVNERVRQIAQHTGPTNDNLLMLLAMLTMADELHDSKAEASALNAQVGQAENQPNQADFELAIADSITEIASRIERIAKQVENG